MISNRIPSRTLRTAVVAGALAVAAFAYAAQAGASTVYVCAKHKGGTVRVVTARAHCHRGESKLSWNTSQAGASGANGKEGPRGKEGPQGKEGPAGKDGANGAVAGYFASNEALVDFTGAVEVTILKRTLPAGNYIVFAKTTLSSQATAVIRAGAHCELLDGTTVLDTSLWSQWLVTYGAAYTGDTTLSLQAALSTKAPSTLSLTCNDLSADEKSQTIGAQFSQIDAIQTSQNS